MWMLISRGVIAGLIVIAVSAVANRSPRLGGFLLTLPLVSIMAFIAAWAQNRDVTPISRLARETLVLVPLGLPFFVPLAFANRFGLGFWPAFAAGLALASVTVGLWLWLGPQGL
jgi:hypothetical protein